jgi:hypothetical protein
VSTRWWAPGGTADTAVLLTPGPDARADLGLFLLAAHQAGAAAMVSVAKNEIASESGIVTALAETRAKVGPQLVDAVAAHLEATYAGLLVADVLDAADRGAVDVYRAMVAKGVAPPVAIERAAEAYGMPMRQMGAFPHHATDPKSNPRVVTDAADRALMSYVSKMADAEAPAGAEVIKALSVAERTDFDQRHPRDATGQFTETEDETTSTRQLSTIDRIRARLGLLEVQPDRVAEITRAPAQSQRQKRKQRAKHEQRTKPTLVATASASAQASAVARLTPLQTQAITQAVNAGAAKPRPPKGTKPVILPELLEPIDDRSGRSYYDIAQPVVIGVPLSVGEALREKGSNQAMTQKNPGRRIFRVGYLTDRANYVEQHGTKQRGAHAASADNTINGHIHEWIEPHVQEISHAEASGNQEEVQDYLKRKRNLEATVQQIGSDGQLVDVVDQRELRYVHSYPVYKPYDPMGDVEPKDWVIVHFQDVGDTDHRGMPTIEEYVVEYNARGVEEGVTQSSTQHADIELDPNQVYELYAPPGKATRRGAIVAPEQLYDKDKHVIVNRYYLRPIDEDEIGGVIKALDVLEARTFEQRHPRDEQGQFAEVAGRPTLVSPAARPMRTQRVKRIQRVQRVARVAPQPTTASATSQAVLTSTTRSAAQAHPLTAALAAPRTSAEVGAGLPPLPVLTDARVYKVLTEDQLQDVLSKTSQTVFSELHASMQPMKLTTDERRAFSEHSDLKVDALPTMLAINVDNEINAQMRRKGLAGLGRDLLDRIKYHVNGEVDAEYLAKRIHRVLDEHPDVDLIELAKEDLDNEILIYGSTVSGAHQNIVEFEPDIDLTGEIEITYLGKYRARDVMARGTKGEFSMIGQLGDLKDPHGVPVANPEIHYYRIAVPKVRRYRADNY